MKIFSSFLRGDILEVGFGNGNFTKSLKTYGRVWAIDIDTKYLRKIKKDIGSNIHIGKGDIEKGNYFFKKRLFDTIVCLNVLEHIRNDSRAFSNMFEILHRGGYLILLVPAHSCLYGSIDISVGHIRRYELQELLTLFVRYDMIIHIRRRINFFGALGWFIAGKIINATSVAENHLRYFNSIAPFVLPLESIIEPIIGTSYIVVAQKK